MANSIENLPEATQILDDDYLILQTPTSTNKIQSVRLRNILKEGKSNSSFNNIVSSYKVFPSARATSEAITISGLDSQREVSIQGPHQPLIKVNNGAYSKSARVQNGDVVYAYLQGSPSNNIKTQYYLNIGSARYEFEVITEKTVAWDKSSLGTPFFDLYADNQDTVILNPLNGRVSEWRSESGGKTFIQDVLGREPYYGNFYGTFNNNANTNSGKILKGVFCNTSYKYLFNGNRNNTPEMDYPKPGEPFTIFSINSTLSNDLNDFFFALGKWNGSDDNEVHSSSHIGFQRGYTLIGQSTTTSGDSPGDSTTRNRNYYEPSICTIICDGENIDMYLNGKYLRTTSNNLNRHFSRMLLFRGHNSYFFNGYISSIVMFKDNLSLQNAQSFEKYLANRFNINEILDSSHPFKLVEPTVLA